LGTDLKRIQVDVRTQRAELFVGDRICKIYVISSSKYGVGVEPGSFKTPTGRFQIHRKIGDGAPLGAVFKGRVATGEVCSGELWSSPEDLILSRILWLEGLDPLNTNTRERFIYLHGTNHEDQLGSAASHGCIRFSNSDICELFDLVEVGTEVVIRD
jgi:hypothetical protein